MSGGKTAGQRTPALRQLALPLFALLSAGCAADPAMEDDSLAPEPDGRLNVVVQTGGPEVNVTMTDTGFAVSATGPADTWVVLFPSWTPTQEPRVNYSLDMHVTSTSFAIHPAFLSEALNSGGSEYFEVFDEPQSSGPRFILASFFEPVIGVVAAAGSSGPWNATFVLDGYGRELVSLTVAAGTGLQVLTTTGLAGAWRLEAEFGQPGWTHATLWSDTLGNYWYIDNPMVEAYRFAFGSGDVLAGPGHAAGDLSDINPPPYPVIAAGRWNDAAGKVSAEVAMAAAVPVDLYLFHVPLDEGLVPDTLRGLYCWPSCGVVPG